MTFSQAYADPPLTIRKYGNGATGTRILVDTGGLWANRPTSPADGAVFIASDTDCSGNNSATAHQCRFDAVAGAWGDLGSSGSSVTSTLGQTFAQGGEITNAICGINPLIVGSTDGTSGVELCYNPTYGPVVTFFPGSTQLTLVGEIYASGVSDDGNGKVACITSLKTLGTCGSVVGIGGTCTCN